MKPHDRCEFGKNEQLKIIHNPADSLFKRRSIPKFQSVILCHHSFKSSHTGRTHIPSIYTPLPSDSCIASRQHVHCHKQRRPSRSQLGRASETCIQLPCRASKKNIASPRASSKIQQPRQRLPFQRCISALRLPFEPAFGQLSSPRHQSG